jgi:hypothetical protein
VGNQLDHLLTSNASHKRCNVVNCTPSESATALQSRME